MYKEANPLMNVLKAGWNAARTGLAAGGANIAKNYGKGKAFSGPVDDAVRAMSGRQALTGHGTRGAMPSLPGFLDPAKSKVLTTMDKAPRLSAAGLAGIGAPTAGYAGYRAMGGSPNHDYNQGQQGFLDAYIGKPVTGQGTRGDLSLLDVPLGDTVQDNRAMRSLDASGALAAINPEGSPRALQQNKELEKQLTAYLTQREQAKQPEAAAPATTADGAPAPTTPNATPNATPEVPGFFQNLRDRWDELDEQTRHTALVGLIATLGLGGLALLFRG